VLAWNIAEVRKPALLLIFFDIERLHFTCVRIVLALSYMTSLLLLFLYFHYLVYLQPLGEGGALFSIEGASNKVTNMG
jgi:hypothetical protein